MNKKLLNKILLWCGAINGIIGSIGVAYNVVKDIVIKSTLNKSIISVNEFPYLAVWSIMLLVGFVTLFYFLWKWKKEQESLKTDSIILKTCLQHVMDERDGK